jgi:hypothetical protein
MVVSLDGCSDKIVVGPSLRSLQEVYVLRTAEWLYCFIIECLQSNSNI